MRLKEILLRRRRTEPAPTPPSSTTIIAQAPPDDELRVVQETYLPGSNGKPVRIGVPLSPTSPDSIIAIAGQFDLELLRLENELKRESDPLTRKYLKFQIAQTKQNCALYGYYRDTLHLDPKKKAQLEQQQLAEAGRNQRQAEATITGPGNAFIKVLRAAKRRQTIATKSNNLIR